jgi:GNAT superfamily N-acetyltransferase
MRAPGDTGAPMTVHVSRADLATIADMREAYRREMACQIVHDSIHGRPGWTEEHAITVDGMPIGYGSVAVAGPWRNAPTLYEYYVVAAQRTRIFALFEHLLGACRSMLIETQSNDVLLTTMLHTFAVDVRSESILFADAEVTSYAPAGAAVRAARPDDVGVLEAAGLDRDATWVVTFDGGIAGAGGVLHHYNPPYGDVYMAIAEPFRGRGLGAYLVQELKRICRQGGHVPAARCGVSNEVSRRTLQRAGFVPCGHILVGRLRTNA